MKAPFWKKVFHKMFRSEKAEALPPASREPGRRTPAEETAPRRPPKPAAHRPPARAVTGEAISIPVPAPVRRIVATLQDSGHEAYVVGGAIRDHLLGQEPKDFDIATSATPEEIKKLFRRQARIIGRRFRIVHLYSGDDVYEVSTFRRTPTAQERKAKAGDDGVRVWNDNHYGSMEEDAFRRDFSANALYYDPVGRRGLIDLVGGRQDIARKRVRILGQAEERLLEDPVRMLRALKLVGQFGFELEPDLERAIRKLAPQIATASQSRLFEESRKILARPFSQATFEALHRYGLLRHCWKTLDDVWRHPQAGRLQEAMFRERDLRLAAGGYTGSKSLAVATAAFPYVVLSLGIQDLDEELWRNDHETLMLIRDAVAGAFAPQPVPKFLVVRAADIIWLLPRFRHHANLARLQRHPEYKYARELFLLLHEIRHWPASWAEIWPEPLAGTAGGRDDYADEIDGDAGDAEALAREHFPDPAGRSPPRQATGPDGEAGPEAGEPAAPKKKRRRRRRKRSGPRPGQAPDAAATPPSPPAEPQDNG